MQKNKIDIISPFAKGTVNIAPSDICITNTYEGLVTPTAVISVDNIKRTITADVNTDMLLTRKEAFKLFSTKQDKFDVTESFAKAIEDLKQELLQTIYAQEAVITSKVMANLKDIIGRGY